MSDDDASPPWIDVNDLMGDLAEAPGAAAELERLVAALRAASVEAGAGGARTDDPAAWPPPDVISRLATLDAAARAFARSAGIRTPGVLHEACARLVGEIDALRASLAPRDPG